VPEPAQNSSRRPTRVTFASVLGTAGCALLVLSLFDTMARLQGTDTREEIADTLADPPFQGSGLSVDQVVEALRVLGYVAGALAAAGVVLAIFVAQRHRGARLGFTVVAALLLLTMPTTGLMPVLPAAAAALLWRRDARDWFAGREPEPAPSRPTAPAAPSSYAAPDRSPHEPPAQQPAPEPAQQPTPGATPPSTDPWSRPYASPPEPPQPQPQPQAQWQPQWQPQPQSQPQWQPDQQWQAAPDDRRPGTVTTAAVLTFLGSGMGLVLGAMLLLGLAVARGEVERAIARDGQLDQLDIAMDQVIAVLWVSGAVLVLWSLAATVLGFLVLRRSAPARVLLAVSAGATAALSLLAILSGVAAVPLLLGIATFVLLFTGGANDWFARRPRGQGGDRVSGPGQPW
jgi:hypothetical protein